MLLPKMEKEKSVIKLAHEGKTTRRIAKIVRVSLKNIGEIIRKATGEDESIYKEKEKKKLSKLSLYAQAVQQFRKKKPLDVVVITLNLDADAILNYYKGYLRLNNMYQLVNLYHHIGDDLPLFLQLFHQVKEKHLGKEEIT